MPPPACPRCADPSARDVSLTCSLGETGLDEGENGAGVPGRLLARPVVGEVVDVDAQGDMGTAAPPAWAPAARHLLTERGGHRGQAAHELVLAVPAPVAPIGDVPGPVGFPGLDLPVVEAPFPGQGPAILELRPGQGSGYGRDHHGPLRAEDLVGHEGQERGIGAAAESDHHDSAPPVQVPAQGIKVTHGGDGSFRVPAPVSGSGCPRRAVHDESPQMPRTSSTGATIPV